MISIRNEVLILIHGFRYITNLASDDIMNIREFIWNIHYIWALPLKVQNNSVFDLVDTKTNRRTRGSAGANITEAKKVTEIEPGSSTFLPEWPAWLAWNPLKFSSISVTFWLHLFGVMAQPPKYIE